MHPAATAGDRAPTEDLLLELADLWLYQHDHTTRLGSSGGELQLVRANQLATVNGLAVMYLLALLREHAPDVADRATRFLRDDPDAWPAPWVEDIRSVVVDWIDTLLAGGAISIPLAPAAQPICP